MDADAVPRPRLRMIVNPVASRVREGSIETARRALEARCDVELVVTTRRGHAIELAAEAVAAGFDGVCAMGGDGTANEVLNGTGDALPVGVLPAGGTSVLPRGLGMPRDVGAAAARVGDALAEGRERIINLGVVNGRRFAFAAGVGADAQAVRLVDGAGRPRGRRPGDAYFAAQIMRTLLRGDFRKPQLEVSMRGRVVARGVSVFAANVHPWSYLGPIPLKLAPRATFEGGLDVVVPSDMRRRHLPRYATQLLLTGSHAYRIDRLLAYLHDVDEVQVSCIRPLPVHADGDDLGDVQEAVFSIARSAARILV
jgi:diacylglycerol kinase family enzyme